MPQPRKVRDSALIDALAASVAGSFDDEIWLVVREGRDPLRYFVDSAFNSFR